MPPTGMAGGRLMTVHHRRKDDETHSSARIGPRFNFQAVIEAIRARRIRAACVALITDNPKAYAIERARKADVPVIVLDLCFLSLEGRV